MLSFAIELLNIELKSQLNVSLCQSGFRLELRHPSGPLKKAASAGCSQIANLGTSMYAVPDFRSSRF